MVLGTLLIGRRGGVRAVIGSLVCLVGLFVLERTDTLPTDPLGDPPKLLWVTALAMLLLGLGYFALVLASRIREQNELALAGQAQAEQNLRLLTDTLDALKVGIEVRDEQGNIQLQNPFAKAVAGHMPSSMPTESSISYRDEFDDERIIDVIAVTPSKSQRANLYVDRTDERLVEQRHFMLERLATLGRALQGIAHELNTPLTTMQTLARDLRAAFDELELDPSVRADVNESIDIIVDESLRCRTLTQSLLQTAHKKSGKEIGDRLILIVERALRLVGQKPDATGEKIVLGEGLDFSLGVDSDRVLQILMNLLQNAVKATKEVAEDRAMRIVIDAQRMLDGSMQVSIVDNGPGLPAEVQERLFEPFVTTRKNGEGTGLGLYTSHRIAHELGGRLELQSVEGSVGTAALLTLPGLQSIDTTKPQH